MIKIFKNLKRQDVYMVLACLAMVVLQVWLDLTMPDYTQKLTSALSAGSLDMSEVLTNGGYMMLCALGSMAASIVGAFFAARVAADFARNVREKLFKKVNDFSMSEINKFSTPSLITRTTNDVVQMQNLIAIGLQVFIKAPIMAVWAIAKISGSSVEWTEAVVVCVVIMLVTILLLVGLVYPKFKQIQELTDGLNDTTRENLTGVRVVRAFNAENYQAAKFDKVNDKMMRNQLFTSRTMGFMMPIMTMCMSGLTLAIYWIGAYLINQEPVMGRAAKLGEMMAFSQYALQVVMAFMMLVAIFMILPRTMVSAKRINAVLDTEPEILYPESGKQSTDTKGKIQFEHVSFSYGDEAEGKVLSDLNFTIETGETFAIIGATGSGKTSLIQLLPRFYDVSEGRILLDGKDVRDYGEKELESKISIAPQRAVLFKGDIKSNVTYGSDAVSEEDARLLKSIEIANADFVANQKKGVLAEVAQGGTNFSGGQKQRLSIARAVYKDADVYIFDDTFSALDYKTDMLVRKSIKENMAGKTVLIVAQRIGTIKNADHILVLHDGKIAGLGKHEELLQTCEIYKEIALSQLSEEELSA